MLSPTDLIPFFLLIFFAALSCWLTVSYLSLKEDLKIEKDENTLAKKTISRYEKVNRPMCRALDFYAASENWVASEKPTKAHSDQGRTAQLALSSYFLYFPD